jgi:hypothetical protein
MASWTTGARWRRRAWLQAAAAIVVLARVPASAQQPAASRLRTLAVLDVELLDDHGNPETQAAQVVRLRAAGTQLRRELAERGLYRLVDTAPAQPVIDRLRSEQAFLHRCDWCPADIGRALGAELVMTTWVQKVSELILNFNVQIHEVSSGRLIFTKSVDMRGNNDVSWTRAVRYLVRDMAEKRAQRPGYGQ